nr:MAG TPA: ssDNA binding protein [Caudoviricetes sp.]
MTTGYSVEIGESSTELSAKERIKMKDTTNAIKLDELTQEEGKGQVVIEPQAYAVLNIHNEHSDQNKDYVNYVLVDKDGTKYVTSSESLWTSFMEIYKEMENESEPWEIVVYRVPSKNFKGKEFLTCSIV